MSKPSYDVFACAIAWLDERAQQALWRRQMAEGLLELGDAIGRTGSHPELLAAYDVVARIFAPDDE